MHIPHDINWDVTPAEAVQIQKEMSSQVVEEDDLKEIRHVAGVDVGFEGEGNRTSRAAVVVLKFPELTPEDYSVARLPVRFPYMPGLLAFREAPVILQALEGLKIDPNVILVDGHGRAHPRRMGIACALGVALNLPTIGCAKTMLIGQAAEPKQKVGAWSPIVSHEETIGAAVRTRVRTRPIYVSIGHRVNLTRAIQVVLACCKGYRLPETTRYAHRVAGGERIDLRTGRMEKR